MKITMKEKYEDMVMSKQYTNENKKSQIHFLYM